MKLDSLDKIIGSYFHAVAKVDYTYKGVVYRAIPLFVSPSVFREYTCPERCGGCCRSWSLDYLPGERTPDTALRREVTFNDKQFKVLSDMQQGQDVWCDKLDLDTGRCNIHKCRPLSCDFELLRVICRKGERNWLGGKMFGRGWNMARVDGERGALCEQLPFSEDAKQDALRKLRRLKSWTDYFELETWLPEIFEWAAHPTLWKNHPLKLDPKEQKGRIF